MKKAKFILSHLLFVFLFFLVLYSPLKAGSLWDSQQIISSENVSSVYGQDPNEPTDVRIYVVRIINTILSILGVITVILIMFAGFKWMTSSGNEEEVRKAKSILKNAIIGLIIIVLSWSISLFVLRRLSTQYLEADQDDTFNWENSND